jgi:Spy/CpxP family protein refolding chaperone
MEKRKLLIGLILFLIITNTATIITVWRHLYASPGDSLPQKEEMVNENSGAIPDNQRTRFFTSELNLNPEQQTTFRNIHRDYMRNARVISMEMNELRDSLLEAMNQNQPDTVRLDKLSEKIGEQHAVLKKLTIQYYLGLKAICNPDQQTKLYEIIRKIIQPDGEVQLPSGQGGPGSGRGMGQGPWWKSKKN